MNGHTFFDDSDHTRSLPHWASITQVSLFLNVPREAVRSVVRRAASNGEPWIKKEFSTNGIVYLIDTTHPAYGAHSERWKQNKTTQEVFSVPIPQSAASRYGRLILSHLLEETSLYSSTFSSTDLWTEQDKDQIGMRYWTMLCDFLEARGLHIFKNVLVQEGCDNPWHWHWDDLHGEGYQSVEEALIAALESKFLRDEQGRQERSCFFPFFRKN